MRKSAMLALATLLIAATGVSAQTSTDTTKMKNRVNNVTCPSCPTVTNQTKPQILRPAQTAASRFKQDPHTGVIYRSGSARIKEVPPPRVQQTAPVVQRSTTTATAPVVQRSTTTATAPVVQRSTTAAPVQRSTTTATAPVKKN
jgi:hypothetical protein